MDNLWTFDDFNNMTILRMDGEATVIVDYYEDEPGVKNYSKPIRLLGFFTNEDQDDFDIRIQAFNYWQELSAEVERILKEG